MLHQFTQLQAAALIADPAGDADVQPQFQAGVEFAARAREAVRDAVHMAAALLAQQRRKIIVGVALVEEQRLAASCSPLQLPGKGAQLGRAWREVAVVVEAAFAHGHDFGLFPQLA